MEQRIPASRANVLQLEKQFPEVVPERVVSNRAYALAIAPESSMKVCHVCSLRVIHDDPEGDNADKCGVQGGHDPHVPLSLRIFWQRRALFGKQVAGNRRYDGLQKIASGKHEDSLTDAPRRIAQRRVSCCQPMCFILL
jgi:hypothetical protein